MPIRVIVNGARGKMGALACETLRQHPDFQLVGALSREDDLAKAIVAQQAEVVVDLTRADCVYENCLTIIQQKAHPVIGTSGLTDAQIQELSAYCESQQLGGIIAPNFSIGAVLMMRFAALAARFMPEVEIVETHHQQKIDAPSGTAMKTAELIAKAREQKKNDLTLHEILPGARGSNYHEVNIHSLRLPGVVARQQVIFGATGETLTLTHDSIDRISFMPGVVFACQKVRQLKTLHYGLDQLLD